MKLATPEDTWAWGHALGASLAAGAVVALCGPLGAGKTQAAKGIVAGLGSQAVVTSPTFTLVHEYRDGRLPVFHFDFYRHERPEAVLAAGWDDILDECGVVVVEWADRFPELLPAEARWFAFKPLPDGSRHVMEKTAP